MNASPAKKVYNDLDRILLLPQRPPLDCEREPGTKRWKPEAQALVEVVTAQFTRGKRLACACRDRHVKSIGNGRVLIYLTGRPDQPPPIPIETTIEAFAADNYYDQEVIKKVGNTALGDTLTLPGLGYPTCADTLNPLQAWTLWEAPRAGGILGMIAVGGGKTWIGMLIPLAVSHLKVWVILIKPDQRRHYRKHYLRLREHFRVPKLVFEDFSGFDIVGEDIPILNVLPYSVLSNHRSSQKLEEINPQGILADEGHLLANPDSSRAMRWDRYMNAHNGMFFGTWSGSIIKRRLRDRTKLSKHALGMGSPDPISDDEVEAWSPIIDPSPVPDRSSPLYHRMRSVLGDGNTSNSLGSLIHDGNIRTGHTERVIRTLGLISTRGSSVSCSIVFKKRDPGPLPEEVTRDLQLVRGAWETPKGDEIVDAMEQATCAREVIAGYYHYWRFPNGEPDELITRWYAARKAFNKELRKKTRNAEPNLDSRKLCEEAAFRAWMQPRYLGDKPVWPAETWPAWVAIRDQVVPEPTVQWISDYLARDAAAWATEHKGIVWCDSTAFGQRVAELAGLPYHAGGPGAEEKIDAEDGSRSVIASIHAHATGRDGLQFKFYKQLVAEAPASGDLWEQLLGRLAREGQQEDTIETWVYAHVFEFREVLRRAVILAEFIEAMSKQTQLILAADWEFDL